MKRYWIGLVIWGAGLVFIWWLSKGDWRVVSAIATWFLALGVAYAFLQIQQARKSTNAQIAVNIFKEFRSPKNIERIQWIYESEHRFSSPEEIETLEDNEKEKIEYVLDRFDVLGVLVAEGIINEKIAIDAYAGVTALRCWYRLYPYIKIIRDWRGYFGDNFEAFTRLSLDCFRKEGINVKFYKKGEEKKGIDLITKLQEKEFEPRSLKKIRRDRKIKREFKGQV